MGITSSDPGLPAILPVRAAVWGEAGRTAVTPFMRAGGLYTFPFFSAGRFRLYVDRQISSTLCHRLGYFMEVYYSPYRC